MSKFWTVVTASFVLAVILLASAGGNVDRGITFTDLETECQYDRGEETRVDLNRDGSLSFRGMYPVESTIAELDYSYRKSGDRITLNVRTTKITPLANFIDACKGVVVYDATTRPVEPGVYRVEVRHQGETVDERVIEVR